MKVRTLIKFHRKLKQYKKIVHKIKKFQMNVFLIHKKGKNQISSNNLNLFPSNN